MYNGSKIMYMHIGKKLNLTFLDSLNFLPMKLAKIPDAFGLKELRKGYFPHLFNTRDNQTYVGPYPDLHYYGYDYMSASERKKLAEWHKTKMYEQFHFQEEMLQYCRSDVDILRRGCMAFRGMMIKATTMETRVIHPDGVEETSTTHGVDPFDYVTIASVCMGIFKTLFLNEEKKVEIIQDSGCTWHDIHYKEGIQGLYLNHRWMSLSDLKKHDNLRVGRQTFTSPIAIVPSTGYTGRDNYSKVSIQWLEWLMEKSKHRGKPIFIQHALNKGEYRIPGTNYRCDGFVEKENGKGTIYEFYG
jgi:hypothetical protein